MGLQKRPQGVEGEKRAGREEIADYAKEQVGERLTFAEQPRDSVGGDGSANDRLECSRKAFLGGHGPSLFAIEPMELGRAQAALAKGRDDRLGRQLCAAERVEHPLTGKRVIEAGCIPDEQCASHGGLTYAKR